MNKVKLTCIKIILPTILLILLTQFCLAQNILGTVKDESNSQVLIGATVNIKDTQIGAVTNADGNFELVYSGNYPVTIVVRYIGYQTFEKQITDNNGGKRIQFLVKKNATALKNIVITDNRLTEKQKESPLTVEALDYIAIKQTSSFNFYEGLGQLKGVDITSASLGFKVINTRGFNSTSPVRSLQLIDGVDNQSPGLNFSLGNFLGACDLDVVKVDLVVGASSAFYGPNAFNGVLSITTKDPFLTQGLSVSVKGGERALLETCVRYAKGFKNKEGKYKFGFKVNGLYMRANDWEATNDAPTEDSKDGKENPGGYDAVNKYGDEFNTSYDYTSPGNVWKNFTGLNRFYRTGYWEKDLVDYNTNNAKLAASLHYKFNDSIEAIIGSNFGTGTTVYQGDNRYSLKNILFLQNRIELRQKNKFFIRAYSTNEDAGKSYDAYFTALLLQQYAKGDIDWKTDYANYWSIQTLGNITGKVKGLPNYPTSDPTNVELINQVLALYQDSLFKWHSQAEDYANNSSLSFFQTQFYKPGTVAFDSALNYITSRLSYAEGGTRFFDKSSLYHVQGEYIFKPKFMNITLGGNFRMYAPNSRGTIFSDTSDAKITNKEAGLYTGADKKFLNDKLKISATFRADKNENFDMVFSPAASAVYNIEKHTFRFSFSSAVRNPTLADQYLYYNVGRAILLGNLNGYDSLVTIESLVNFFNSQKKDTLSYFNVNPIQPEKVRTFEVGYRASLFKHIYVDASYYFSYYKSFIGYKIGADIEYNSLFNTINALQAYRVASNADGIVTTNGFTIGVNYFFKKYFTINGNYSLNVLNKKEDQDPIIPAFNTPKHKFNLGISGRDINGHIRSLKIKNFGFNANYKWVQGFTFEGSPQFTGALPTYDMVDVQMNKFFPKMNLTAKVGASNLFGIVPLFNTEVEKLGDRISNALNNKHLEVYGGPFIGRLAYISLVYEIKYF
jgi:iron complex outermembrane receptor protein